MRKASAIFLVLFLVFASFYTYAAFDINKEKDNVTFRETVLQGDKSLAEGVSIKTSYEFQRRLFWDTTLTLGNENSIETDFTFRKNYTYEYDEPEDRLSIYTDTGYSLSSTGDTFEKDASELKGIDKAFKELYDIAKPGVDTEKIIFYKDFYDYYPLSGDCYANGVSINFGVIYDFHDDKRGTELQKKLEEYFKIPILDEECREIHLLKDENNNVISLGTSQVTDNSDYYGFSAEKAVSNKGIYISFSNRTALGNTVDTSLIPGGYGVYFFPYQKSGLDFDNIQTVYPVDEEDEIISISMNKEKTKLHLITKEKGKLILNVIDEETMNCLQRIVLHEIGKETHDVDYPGASILETDKDFIVYCVYDELNSFISVVTANENGYKQVLKTENTLGVYDADFEWDGKYLYYADYTSDYGTFRGSVSNVRVAVLSGGGPEFYAEYEPSLNTGEAEQYSSNYYCNAKSYYPTIILPK